MKKPQKIAIIFAMVVILVFALLILIPVKIRAGDKIEITIEKGSGSTEIANILSRDNLIRSRYAFWIYLTITGKVNHLQAGRYKLSPSMNIPTIVEILDKGLAESEDISVTIPEGTNIADLVRIFEKAGLSQAKEILEKNNLIYEGFLFPDTYRFAGDEQSNEILNKMLNNFAVKTSKLLDSRNMMSTSNKKIVTIASMLEKEVRTEEDMRLVAGIIEKRMERGMSLEIDATVTYGVCFPEFQKGNYCDVSMANIVDNLKTNSVYNSYIIKGLPPAPISNPGLKAISATLNPLSSDYLYYLSTDTGKTIFSKTGAEHEKARKIYIE